MNPRPVFRKTISPWYDSDAACLVAVAAMGGVFLFGLTGILTAWETPGFARFWWIPLILCILSGPVLVSISFRLFHRQFQKRKENMLLSDWENPES
jgi:hypothetical protein